MALSRTLIALVLAFLSLVSCNSGVKDLIDVADGVPRKPIDTGKLGVNAFANDSRFGSASRQFAEVRNTLRLGYVRILLDWNNGIQSSKGATPNFSFYDSIIGVPS